MSSDHRPSLAFSQAAKALASPAVRQANLVNAVFTALHLINAGEDRPFETMYRALVLRISPTDVEFQLHENETLLCRMRYTFDPEEYPGPHLAELFAPGDYRETPRSRHLQRAFDHLLASLEGQVWARVDYALSGR
jgi:hypothetical protein